MAMTDLPLVSMLKGRLQWYEARQKVLAGNVSNANTPNFKPQDLREPILPGSSGLNGSSVRLETTSPLHLATVGGGSGIEIVKQDRIETGSSGNGVSIEDEMMKVAQNQSDYQLAAGLYQKSLSMLKTAVGHGS